MATLARQVSITRKMVHPSPILFESRLGSQFILSRSAMSHAFSGPRFPPVVALRSVSHGCKGALLQPWRAQGRGSVRRPRRLRNWLAIRHRQRGGLRVVSYCPRLRPWAGGGLGGKPAGGRALGLLGCPVYGPSLVPCLLCGLGLRLALGLAFGSRGAAYGFRYELAH